METRSAKRRKLLNPPENNSGEDRITDLPNAVLHRILILLPIRSIATTSLLSKQWRSIWHTLPDLDFTTVIPSENNSLRKFIYLKNLGNWIIQVLSTRDKLSDIRILRFCAYTSFSGLHALIRSAIRHRVQELDIEVATNDTFNFPRSIISSDCLRVLRLKSYPGFRLLPSRIMKSGFQTLQTLSLSCLDLKNQSFLLDMFTENSFPLLKKLYLDSCLMLKHLRIRCRLLEELGLENCCHLLGLEIFCPKLENLRVLSCFDAFGGDTWLHVDAPRLNVVVWVNNVVANNCCMENLVCLHEVTVGLLVLQENLSDGQKLMGMSSFLDGLSHSESLTVESQCVEILSKNNSVAATFFHPFVNLKSLELHTSEVPGLASLFKVCPIIDTLIIKITSGYKAERRWNRHSWDLSTSWEERYWESQNDELKPFLHYLKVIKIQGFSECDNDISLVKFLLKHGRVLQDLIIYPGDYTTRGSLRREKIKLQMMGFSRASSDAKLKFH